ncbi:MAG: YfhO family protein [Clostridia bacterium]|nr:YfhO family protein [Clostridia bacterium]
MPFRPQSDTPLVSLPQHLSLKKRRTLLLALFFLALFLPLFLILHSQPQLTTASQKFLYPVGFSLLIAGLATLWLGMRWRLISADDSDKWFYPLLSALLALVGFCLAYTWVGMWPVGEKTAMIVDMHHQYAPLLAQLRKMLLSGDSFLYTFEVGLGASFLPLFGYYLSSPFNLLLLLFSETYLAEGILLITLLKNMLTAGLFAAAVQYIYKQRSYAIPVAALLYAMSAFVLAYSWNIMWLDPLMVLPLAVLGFEKLMREGKYLTYVLSLGYILYSNYYIGFMCCVFLVLYYLYFVLRRQRSAREIGASLTRFALGSLIGGLLSFVLLIPVAMALGQTSAAGGELGEAATTFPIWSLFTQLFYAPVPTIRSGNLPNLYTGVLAAFLLPLYATTAAIPLRRRLSGIGLLSVIALSMTVNNTDLLWHGLHSPNDLPYRYSFLFSLVLALIAYEALLHIKQFSRKQIGLAAFGLIAFLVANQYASSDNEMTLTSLYVSLGLIAVYALITFCIAHRQTARRIGYVLLLTAVVAECVSNATNVLVTLNNNEFYTSHASYTDNTVTEALRKTVASMQEIDQKENDRAFYRMEFAPRRTCVDTALYHYAGITVFASSNSYEETRLMGSLGYAVNGVNSHLYHNYNPLTDSLLGIKYIASSTPISSLPEIDTVVHEDQTFHIYRNADALAVGYVVDNDIRNWSYSYYNPIDSQNSLIEAMTDVETPLFRYQQLESVGSTVSGTSGFNMSEGSAEFSCTLEESGMAFIYVDCRAAESISASATVGEDYRDWSITPYEPYIINVGDMEAGQTIQFTVNAEGYCSGNIYVAVLDRTAYTEAMQQLSAEQLKVTASGDSSLSGTVRSDEGGVMFTSIPYDAGWTVKVDGQKVETFAAGEGLLAFGVESGNHEVELSFMPRGLLLGAACSLVGIGLLVLLCVLLKRYPHRRLALNESAPFDDLCEEELPPLLAEEFSDPATPDDTLPENPFADAAPSEEEESL